MRILTMFFVAVDTSVSVEKFFLLLKKGEKIRDPRKEDIIYPHSEMEILQIYQN